MQEKIEDFMLAMDSLFADNKYKEGEVIIDGRFKENLRHDAIDVLCDIFGYEVLKLIDVVVDENYMAPSSVTVSFINKRTGNVISDTNELETLLRRIL
jgi:hypothetical protein